MAGSREEAFELFRQTSAFAYLRNRAHKDALRAAFLEGFDAGGAARDEAFKLRREGDPNTSHAAAEKIVPAMSGLRAEFYAFLLEGPRRFTHHEAIERIRSEFVSEDGGQMAESTIRTRLRELADMGKVRDTGETVERPNGRDVIVWEVLEA